MYPLSFPLIGISEITFRARNAVGVTHSPFTFDRQVHVFDGQRWEADIRLPSFDVEQAGAVESFLLQLNGRKGTFLLGDPLRTTPQGSASGTPRVKGSGQTGIYVMTTGWTPNMTNLLCVGDWIQLGWGATSRLHKILYDVNSDANGDALLTLWPSLRSSPADQAVIVTTECRGVFALTENIAEWTIDKNGLYSTSFTAWEVV